MQEVDETTQIGFLGRGWAFPPVFDRADVDLELSAGNLDIRESLMILLSTVPGERKMNPDYGCDLTPMLFEPLTLSLKKRMSDQIERCILKYEPRIIVEDVNFKTSTDGSMNGGQLSYNDRDLLKEMMKKVVTDEAQHNYGFKGKDEDHESVKGEIVRKKGDIGDGYVPTEKNQGGGTSGTTVFINVHYLVRRTNTRTNLVFPYYLKEATNI